MSKRVQVTAAGVILCLAALILSPLAPVQGDPPASPTEPIFRHGLELRVRKAGEADFSDTTKKVGVEFFQEGDAGNGLYIQQAAEGDSGNLAAVPAKLVTKEAGKVKAPEWKHGMELRARKVGEKEFTKDTKRYGVEVFRDENNGNFVYLSETGDIDVVPGGLGVDDKDKTVKAPTWKNAMELRVRKAGDADFNDKTSKVAIEVFLDENNGNIVYITEKGSIGVLPASKAKIDDSKKAPDWKHGMELAARKADEKEFGKETKKYGVEVFLDQGTGAVLYVSETGDIAVVAASLSGLPSPGAKVQAPEWKRGMVLAARKPGEADFSKATKRYGVECFLDPNTGNTVYISETGSLTVVGGKDA